MIKIESAEKGSKPFQLEKFSLFKKKHIRDIY